MLSEESDTFKTIETKFDASAAKFETKKKILQNTMF